MNKQILFHVGYYKTGTTFLQKQFFGDPDSGFSSICPEYIQDPRQRSCYISKFFIFSSDDKIASPWQGLPENLEDTINNLITPELGVPVVSHERFLGYPFAAGLDAASVLKRIKKFAPNAKILIVVREQHALIMSTYFQYLRRGGKMSLSQVLEHKYDWRVAYFNKEYYCYDLAVKAYMESFGRDNVLVLPFELMQKSPSDFINKIYEFCDLENPNAIVSDTKENESNSKFVELLFRRLNALETQTSLNGYSSIGRSLGAKRLDKLKGTLSTWVPNYVEDRTTQRLRRDLEIILPRTVFSGSNHRLSELVGFDLKKYGYTI